MDVERGAYMKAIGVLVQKYAWKHTEFLRKELR
jgi:hypothetical protein